MSDLVERLRNPQKFTSVVPWAVLDEAADTIQRLEAEKESWRIQAELANKARFALQSVTPSTPFA
jgi:hypothetical protein